MAGKKPSTVSARSAASAAPSAAQVALSRRVAKCMTSIPIPQQSTVAKAVTNAKDFASLPKNVQALVIAAEKGNTP